MAKIFDQIWKKGALERFGDVGFVVSFISFVVYLDLMLANFYGTNLHGLDYAWGDRIPIGDSVLLLAGFGFGSVFLAHWIRLPMACIISRWTAWRRNLSGRMQLPQTLTKEQEERSRKLVPERELLRMGLFENRSNALKLRDDLLGSEAARDREQLRQTWAGILFLLLLVFGSDTSLMQLDSPESAIMQYAFGFFAFIFLIVGGQPKSIYGPRLFVPYPYDELKHRPDVDASDDEEEQ